MCPGRERRGGTRIQLDAHLVLVFVEFPARGAGTWFERRCMTACGVNGGGTCVWVEESLVWIHVLERSNESNAADCFYQIAP